MNPEYLIWYLQGTIPALFLFFWYPGPLFFRNAAVPIIVVHVIMLVSRGHWMTAILTLIGSCLVIVVIPLALFFRPLMVDLWSERVNDCGMVQLLRNRGKKDGRISREKPNE